MTHILRCLVLAAAVGVLAGGVARADLALEFNPGAEVLTSGPNTFGWKFTTFTNVGIKKAFGPRLGVVTRNSCLPKVPT